MLMGPTLVLQEAWISNRIKLDQKNYPRAAFDPKEPLIILIYTVVFYMGHT